MHTQALKLCVCVCGNDIIIMSLAGQWEMPLLCVWTLIQQILPSSVCLARAQVMLLREEAQKHHSRLVRDDQP